MIYAPELGQVAEARVFNIEHNYGSSYNVVWKAEDDVCAREVLRKLRIRPAFRSEFELRPLGCGNLWSERLGSDVYQILVTSAAYRKLSDIDVAAILELLD
jgi:hypothetical protein